MTGDITQVASERKTRPDEDTWNTAKTVAAFEAKFGRPPQVVTAAPGRIEIVGNHTDYNGGLVLGAAIDREIFVAVAPRSDDRRRFATEADRDQVVEVPAGPIARQQDSAAWANYPIGVIEMLRVAGIEVSTGFDFLICSTLPAGSGLSSSAALELASALAFLHLAERSLPAEQIIALCRKAENEFVGVPCGILDQAVSAFGRKNHLVSIDCRKPKFTTVPLPEGIHFWVFNTHTRHALIDGLYAVRHRECMDAAQSIGVPWLADASAELLADSPGRMSDLLARRAAHIIGENARVRSMIAMLQTGELTAVGRLLNESHLSSQNNFENSSPELDFLAAKLTDIPNVRGARLTGGGFGGAVLALTKPDFGWEIANAIARTYAEHFDAKPDVMHLRTSDGARVLLGRHYPAFT